MVREYSSTIFATRGSPTWYMSNLFQIYLFTNLSHHVVEMLLGKACQAIQTSVLIMQQSN